MAGDVRIDFVADISCPWCIIGLKSIEQAIIRLDGRVNVAIHCQPFELNPAMGAEGEASDVHLGAKTGMSPVQIAAGRQAIIERAGAAGFAMRMSADTRIYNTFDAHRLLYWARGSGKQVEFNHGIYAAYFSDGKDISDHRVLVETARCAGLDGNEAALTLASDAHARDVRAAEAIWHARGINSVPAIILDDRHLILGGQPPDVIAAAILKVAG